jgi:amidase
MTELSGMRQEIVQEWSGRGGECFSAYVPNGTPMGSSCGSAVALSAGFVAGCLGGDTTGSIIFPSSRAACYSLRPTVGLVCTDGCIPVSTYLDAIGPIAKSAYDAATLLTAMTGKAHESAQSESRHPQISNNRWENVRTQCL